MRSRGDVGVPVIHRGLRCLTEHHLLGRRDFAHRHDLPFARLLALRLFGPVRRPWKQVELSGNERHGFIGPPSVSCPRGRLLAETASAASEDTAGVSRYMTTGPVSSSRLPPAP